jgi:hypothetical protein
MKCLMPVCVLLWLSVSAVSQEAPIEVRLDLPQDSVCVLEPLVTDVTITFKEPYVVGGVWTDWSYGDWGIDVQFRRRGSAVWRRFQSAMQDLRKQAQVFAEYDSGDQIVVRDIGFHGPGQGLDEAGVYELRAVYEPFTKDRYSRKSKTNYKSPLVYLTIEGPEGQAAEALELWRAGFEAKGSWVLGYAGATQEMTNEAAAQVGRASPQLEGAPFFGRIAEFYSETPYGKWVRFLRAKEGLGMVGVGPKPQAMGDFRRQSPDFVLEDEAAWREIATSAQIADPEALRAYIEEYPDSPWSLAAERNLRRLKGEKPDVGGVRRAP